MTSTAFSKGLLLFIFCLLAGGGCLNFTPEEQTLETLQRAVRQRMLKLQTTELLAAAAQEHYKPAKAAEIFAWESGYGERKWSVGSDPALQVLENAIAYGLVATSRTPEKTAEQVTGAVLDYGTALSFLKLRTEKERSALSDRITELAVMTGWSREKVEGCLTIPLPEVSADFFPIRPETERLLNERGVGAVFRTAAELYRKPSAAGLLQAERMRQALLNRYLLQIKISGTHGLPELFIAVQRGKLFSEFF